MISIPVDLAAVGEILDNLNTPDALEALLAAQADADAGRYVDNAELKAGYGVI